MIKKESTGKIDINLTAEVILPKVIGEIVKVRIYNRKENSPEIRIKIITSDGEEIIDREIGNKNCIFYPKNKDAINEFVNLDTRESVTIETKISERYINVGILRIEIEGGNKDDYLENIVITVK